MLVIFANWTTNPNWIDHLWLISSSLLKAQPNSHLFHEAFLIGSLCLTHTHTLTHTHRHMPSVPPQPNVYTSIEHLLPVCFPLEGKYHVSFIFGCSTTISHRGHIATIKERWLPAFKQRSTVEANNILNMGCPTRQWDDAIKGVHFGQAME